MLKKTTLLVAASSALVLSGCIGDDTTTMQGDTKTVSWFVDHEQERKAVIAECENNPGELFSTPNCINAIEAKREIKKAKRQATLDRHRERIDKQLAEDRARWEKLNGQSAE